MRLPSKLDLNLLRVAVALLDTGSVSQAAARLGVSQPSMSESLGKLRRYFGDPLFVRSRNCMRPTARGASVAGACRDILDEITTSLGAPARFDAARRHRPFTFAMSDVGEIVFLPKLLRSLECASPETPVRAVSLRPHELAKSLEDGDVDLAIGYYPDLKRGDVFQQRLFTHHFVCLVRLGHPAVGDRLTLERFLSLPHIAVHSEGWTHEALERYLAELGFARRIVLHTPHFLGIAALTAQSDAITTVPHALGMAFGRPALGVKALPLPFPSPMIHLRQHWHAKFHKDPRSIWLRELVSDLFNDTTDSWLPSESTA